MPLTGIYRELWQPFVQRSATICSILVEGIMRDNFVILFRILVLLSGSGGDVV